MSHFRLGMRHEHYWAIFGVIFCLGLIFTSYYFGMVLLAQQKNEKYIGYKKKRIITTLLCYFSSSIYGILFLFTTNNTIIKWKYYNIIISKYIINCTIFFYIFSKLMYYTSIIYSIYILNNISEIFIKSKHFKYIITIWNILTYIFFIGVYIIFIIFEPEISNVYLKHRVITIISPSNEATFINAILSIIFIIIWTTFCLWIYHYKIILINNNTSTNHNRTNDEIANILGLLSKDYLLIFVSSFITIIFISWCLFSDKLINIFSCFDLICNVYCIYFMYEFHYDINETTYCPIYCCKCLEYDETQGIKILSAVEMDGYTLTHTNNKSNNININDDIDEPSSVYNEQIIDKYLSSQNNNNNNDDNNS